MILQDSSDLKKLISNLNFSISRSQISVERQRLYELFACSQGFESDAALRSSLPILVETDKANEILMPLIEKHGKKSADYYLYSFNYLKTAAQLAQPFPCVARDDSFIAMQIDWDDGFISLPYLRPESEKNSRSWDEFYGNCLTLILPVRVDEEEYAGLIKRIKPLVDAVTEGYTYNGPEQHASFTKAAERAIEDIRYAVSDFEFFETAIEPLPPWYPYDDGWHWEPFTEEYGLTEIHLEGSVLLDYSYSDIALRQLVAEWMIAYDFPTNEDGFHELLVELRDICRENHKNKEP